MDTPKKPNIKLPEGFYLVWNNATQHWAMRPTPGYSATYLKKDSFIPKKKKEGKPVTNTETAKFTKKGKNANLHSAKREKNDEFYTRLEDVVAELKHYKEFFKDKVIYCPCDKAYNLGRSNFFAYFSQMFHELGIKKVICTQYVPEGRGVVKEFSGGIRWDYSGEVLGRVPDESEIDTQFLKGNGSFDSEECKQIMRECDIVVTNPPFSLFREFVSQIMELGKQFLIIGSMNAITYKEIFPLIKGNKMWLGYNTPHDFEVTLNKIEDETKQYEENGRIYQKFGNICWYTNLRHHKRMNEELSLQRYIEGEYPKYDNYDAINVDKVVDIPNYEGIMGVPITFLFNYNPNQFEILGQMANTKVDECNFGYPFINGERKYARILIKKLS